MTRMTGFALTALLVLATPMDPLMASPNYTYAEAGFLRLDGGADGLVLGGSYALDERFHLVGEFARASESPITVTRARLGVGYHYAYSGTTDWVLRGGAILARARISGLGSINDSGWFAEAGLRSLVTDFIEVNGFVTHSDAGAATTQLSLTGWYHFTRRLALGAGLNDEVDLTLWVRFGF